MSNLADAFEKWWKQVKKDKSCKQAEDKVAAIFISGWRACEMAIRDGGKGDTPRPLGVPMEQFDKNFDAIFKKSEIKPKSVNFELEADNDEQEVTVTKTWEL
jgi:hypothetical protein